ncbi:DUF1836 domain-containing protein [Furfurilactobacillus siliginis]|uniref:DUF1836 domain-containing protein n=1 Tax=Furfurilactobacillus siliginis TaxID=348151 RepID=A0A0R2KWR3_9LACO|nr:DUF1836 domain-containing protein [Furfurilactobacillus siliginis]KRN93979.1 hypothetical protein IV55_GL000636 [Furfurilactobacillus siliginis]GEK29229.1 hypothetical protein LSI01_15400 [Furfurilactobacillus siliginis]
MAEKEMVLPRWEELPSIDLHLDQLLELTNGYLAPITGDKITKTMMHNYFKAEVIVAPDKKSYHQIHLAGAIIVGLLKGIFTLDELKTALQSILNARYPQAGYNRFVDMFNHEAHNDAFKQSKLDGEDLGAMSPMTIIQYDALEALLFWLSARRRLHEITTKEES